MVSLLYLDSEYREAFIKCLAELCPETETELDTSQARKVYRWDSDDIAAFKYLLKFHEKKCTYPECRLCIDNCPMDGIDLSMRPPVIARPCMNCTFCAKICPTGALDESAWVETFIKRTRVLFPLFYLPGLEQPEAEGQFRRLVPV